MTRITIKQCDNCKRNLETRKYYLSMETYCGRKSIGNDLNELKHPVDFCNLHCLQDWLDRWKEL